MKANKYRAACAACGSMVQPNAGELSKVDGQWQVRHLACADGVGRVIETYIPSTGWRGTRNARGLCEDAPCCGCCTF